MHLLLGLFFFHQAILDKISMFQDFESNQLPSVFHNVTGVAGEVLITSLHVVLQGSI